MTSTIKKPCQQPLIMGAYIPKRFRRTASPADVEYTLKILRLKWKKIDVIEYFAGILDPVMPADTPICIIPSHDASLKYPGIRLLAQHLCKSKGRIDATSCLTRVTSTPEMRTGSLRNERMHFDTICVSHKELIEGRNIVLLDDVVSSGCSMRACKHLLLGGGAQSVFCISLSKTVHLIK
jgi:predicted amidophosphoribosyltransferase